MNSRFAEVFADIDETRFLLSLSYKKFFPSDGLSELDVKLNCMQYLLNFWHRILEKFENVFFQIYNESLATKDFSICSEDFVEVSATVTLDLFSLIRVKVSAWSRFLDELECVIRWKCVDEVDSESAYLAKELEIRVKSCTEQSWRIKGREA